MMTKLIASLAIIALTGCGTAQEDRSSPAAAEPEWGAAECWVASAMSWVPGRVARAKGCPAARLSTDR
jgi:hypothetical protein